jgi:hypothetical protein
MSYVRTRTPNKINGLCVRQLQTGLAMRADSGRMEDDGKLQAINISTIVDVSVTQTTVQAGTHGGDMLAFMPYANISKRT